MSYYDTNLQLYGTGDRRLRVKQWKFGVSGKQNKTRVSIDILDKPKVSSFVL